MPIYTYRCESCGVQFERRQTFTDEPLKRCPECNKNRLRKVLTPAGIIFKGSGWYATDHKSPSGQNRPIKGENKESDSHTAESSPAATSSTEGPAKAGKPEGSAGSEKSESSGSKAESASRKTESASSTSKSAEK